MGWGEGFLYYEFYAWGLMDSEWEGGVLGRWSGFTL